MSNNEIKYQLDDKMPLRENLIYACQHVIFFVASAVVMPVVVGYALGLSQPEVAQTLQRTLVLCGIISILQTALGHRYPIIDGPAGLWSGLLILMATTMTAFGKDAQILRTDLETGMIIGGGFVILLVILGLMNKLITLFSPLINGVLILLMVLQISPSIVKGMTGITADNTVIDGKSTFVFFFTMLLILFLNMYARGFIKSIATFIGVLAGWVLAWVMGITTQADLSAGGVVSLPEVFAWGKPTFDTGVVITCVIAAFVLLSMTFASINGMAEVVEDRPDNKRFNRAVSIHGLATVLCGIFPTVAFMPYVSSTGIVKMTGVAARTPFYLASAFMIVMGMISPIGAFFSTIPNAVGYAALIMIYALIMGQGFNELKKVKFTNRENFIVGISMLIGMGVMFLPTEAFSDLPQVAGYILSNGLIDGMALAFLLEHVLLKKKKQTP
ncbi:MAG: uracil-xanthine permease family protein [Emergencia sp.]|nr:purine/pyrimidine permease [Emergencia sp.]